MLVALASAKGSPGVTTTALALAASAASQPSDDGQGLRGPCLAVEVDPAGGDLECWCGPLGEPGLVRGVTGEGTQGQRYRWIDAAVPAVPGVPAVTAPTAAVAASATLSLATGWLPGALADVNGLVLADCGRWAEAGTDLARGMLGAASLVVVVCRPTLSSVEHARGLVDVVRRSSSGAVAAVVVGGTVPYGPDEISGALGVPVPGVLPWDPRGVGILIEQGAGRSWRRCALGVAADRALADLLVLPRTVREVRSG